MASTLRDNWALFVGMALLMTANGLLVVLLSVRGLAVGFSETEIGLMQACYPLGAMVGCVATPRLIERVGHVRAFGALASLCSIAAVVHLTTSDLAAWSAMRFLAGFCFPGLYVVAESWLNARVENQRRAAVLSLYFVVQTAAAAGGQALAGLEDPSGIRLFSLASILISVSLAPLLLSRAPAPPFEAPERLSLGALLRASPTALVGVFLSGVAQSAFYVATPLYGLAAGLDQAGAAGLLVLGTIAGALAQFPLGWISDRYDRRVVVGLASLAGAGVSGAAVAGLLGGAALFALFAAATLPVYSILIAHANDRLRPAQIVPASGTLVLTLNCGVMVGAFLGPFAIGRFGPDALPALFGVVTAATAALALVRRAAGADALAAPRAAETRPAQTR